MSKDLDRRDFVKASLAAAAGATIGKGAFAAAAPAAKTITTGGAIPTRVLGKTGHTLPVLGHGGSAMVKMWGKDLGVEVQPFEERAAMVRHGYDTGIRYFDTARIYQDSENVMGAGLQGVRDNVYLCTKVTVGTPEEVRPSAEKSLEALRTSYIDCLQLHGPVYERAGYDGAMRIAEEIGRLRDEGLCRFVGLTGHGGFDVQRRLVSSGGFDQLMVAYGYFPRAYDSTISQPSLAVRDLSLAAAHERGMGVVAMKVLGASFLGHRVGDVAPELAAAERRSLIGAAIRWVLQDPRIAVLNIGMSVPEDIDHDVEVLTGDLTLTPEDRGLLARFTAQAFASPAVKEMKVT
jgi:aryl-alcohol dehydrogenase-like predicted oxidoreductase